MDGDNAFNRQVPGIRGARKDSRTSSFSRQVPGAGLVLPEGRLLVDRYEVRRRIGSGGLGAVFAAWDRERGEEIAIKVLLPGLLEEERAGKCLLHEAKLASRLSHPGIAEVFDVGSDGDLHFITMELLKGASLRRRLDAQSSGDRLFPVDEAVHLGIALCDALSYAHQHMVHGGIKPENIMLCDDGTVKLMDFGIARVVDVNQSAMIGISTGATFYLAPEQLKGSTDVDHRADQYAVAAVLYEVLTGEPPAGRVKPAKERRLHVPRSLSRALDRALEANPAERFPDMDAFAAGLTGRSSRRGKGRRIWAAAAAILLVIVAGATFSRWAGPVRSAIRSVLGDSAAQAAAQTARVDALVSASSWQSIAKALPEDQLPEEIIRADEALAAGDEHFAAMAYHEAEESFRQASVKYESLVAVATKLFRDAPARVAGGARDLFAQLEARQWKLYGRAAEAARLVNGCERSLRTARTDDERKAIEGRKRAAEAEANLINRLRSLTQANVFSASVRAQVAGSLDKADRQLEATRYREALSSYAVIKARLEGLLAWPDQVESALRERSDLIQEIEEVRSALGPTTRGLAGVQSALDDAGARIALGDDELDAGRVSEASALFESAGKHLSEVKVKAVTGLMSQARQYDDEGKRTAAVLALDELLALAPDHTAGGQLRSKILSHRITNSIGIELVFIPPGEFVMGSLSDESGRDEDERQHRVKIARGFYMGATEVTQSQWSAVMDANPSKWEGDDLPVEQVAWEDVNEFCRKLTQKEGRRYRLPTEAEWEYACRAGTTDPFSFGETISTAQANYDGDYAYGNGYKGVFRETTVPVGSFPASAWGLYDMHGNVWEWCPDDHKDDPQTKVPAAPRKSVAAGPRDGRDQAPTESADRLETGPTAIEGRVLRGGSWRSRPRYCRCANRVRDTEDSRLSNIGFRVVLESQ